MLFVVAIIGMTIGKTVGNRKDWEEEGSAPSLP